MNVEDFKSIFYMEWGHRILGRLIGVVFAAPYVYLLARRRLPGSLKYQLGGLGILLGAQGALGWYMVKSGLDEQIIHDNAVPRVSQYRLAAHLGAAFLFYIGCMKFGLAIRRDVAWAKGGLVSGLGDGFLAVLNNPAVRKFKRAGGLLFTLVFLTAISGNPYLWLCWVVLTYIQVHSSRVWMPGLSIMNSHTWGTDSYRPRMNFCLPHMLRAQVNRTYGETFSKTQPLSNLITVFW